MSALCRLRVFTMAVQGVHTCLRKTWRVTRDCFLWYFLLAFVPGFVTLWGVVVAPGNERCRYRQAPFGYISFVSLKAGGIGL